MGSGALLFVEVGTKNPKGSTPKVGEGELLWRIKHEVFYPQGETGAYFATQKQASEFNPYWSTIEAPWEAGLCCL